MLMTNGPPEMMGPEGDKKVSGKDEVRIKAELLSRGLDTLIERFNAATSPEDKAKLQKQITKLAGQIHNTLKSSES